MRNQEKSLLTRQVEGLQSLIEDLRERVREQNALISDLRASRAELLEEKLRKEKGFNTLVSIADDYDKVDAENEQMRAQQEALRTHLQQLLKYTKSLQNAYRA